MTGPDGRRDRRRWWTATLALKGMLMVQLGLAALVVAGDLPASLSDLLPAPGPAVPPIDQPVRPGDQIRRFDPERTPVDLPENPYLSPGQDLPRELQFGQIASGQDEVMVLLNGMIAPGDADRFSRWINALTTEPSGFLLNSPGGSVTDALQIGRKLRDKGLSVTVPKNAICLSACPYVLAGGVDRIVSRTSTVGVHQHYFGENTYLPAFLLVSDIQSGQAEVMTYLSDMGIDPLLMAKALETPPDDIYILVEGEMTGFRLATSLTD